MSERPQEPDAAPIRWRILVHALDRTGPPMLVRSFVRWLHEQVPLDPIEVLAFRGGPLEADLEPMARVTVVLDHHEPWDHERPDPDRAAALRRRLATLEPVDVNLLVSTSGGQVLPLLGDHVGPVVTWSVEMGPDLHWLDGDVISLRARTDVWLAGSSTTAAELARLLDGPAPAVVPEFVDQPSPASAEEEDRVRSATGIDPATPLVLGAGIGTHRKGMDLFVEVAVAVAARTDRPVHFAWVGGEADPLYPLVDAEVQRLGIEHVTLHPPVPDLTPWLRTASLFVHTAREDAFPLVCLHAAAVGVPVVAFSGTGGVTEMFGDAFVGDPFPDVAALADRVVSLTDGSAGATRHALGEAQRQRVAADHLAPAAAATLREAVLSALDHAAVAP